MAVWTPGIDNYRVQYQADYIQIPNDVQEACAEWTAALFWQSKGNPRRRHQHRRQTWR
jgi:hypothetical protein